MLFTFATGAAGFVALGSLTLAADARSPIAGHGIPGDDCTDPILLAGEGSFAFDSSLSTTSGPGSCGWSLGDDLWFLWTSDADGTVEIQACLEGQETILALWPTPTCPTGSLTPTCAGGECGGTLDVFDNPSPPQVFQRVTAGESFLVQIAAIQGQPGGPGRLSVVIHPDPPNDDCRAPTLIAGEGAFAFSTIGATTGVEGQGEPLCQGEEGPALRNDVWYEWTAPRSGIACFEACDMAKMAAYRGGACPSAGGALACSSEDCLFQRGVRLRAPVVKGEVLLLQVGQAPLGPSFASGEFEVTVHDRVPNDECWNPTRIEGQGVFPFTNFGATESPRPRCPSGVHLDNDVWFEWIPDRDGQAVLRTCGSNESEAMRLAAWPGGECPESGSSLACWGAPCGRSGQVSLTIDVRRGEPYLIQAGNFPGGVTSRAELEVLITERPAGYFADSGLSTHAFAGPPWEELTEGGGVLWVNAFQVDERYDYDILREVSTAFGSPLYGQNPTAMDITIAVWNDMDDDLFPDQLELLCAVPGVSSLEDTDAFVSYPIPPVRVEGSFFVGILCDAPPLARPSPMDSGIAAGLSGASSWVYSLSNDFGGYAAVELDQPNAHFFWDGAGWNDGYGVWLLRAAGSARGLGIGYCSASPNSVSDTGARISASGSLDLAGGDVVLRAEDVPAQPGFFFYGTEEVREPMGNGTRCVGGAVRGLPPAVATGGTLVHPVDLSVHGSNLARIQSVRFQCWYRDSAGGGLNSNLSDALLVNFHP